MDDFQFFSFLAVVVLGFVVWGYILYLKDQQRYCRACRKKMDESEVGLLKGFCSEACRRSFEVEREKKKRRRGARSKSRVRKKAATDTVVALAEAEERKINNGWVNSQREKRFRAYREGRLKPPATTPAATTEKAVDSERSA